VKIPAPEFYTFYNGKAEFPLEQELFLSDSFLDSNGKASLELMVKVININSNKAHSILDKCEVLKEYSLFIDTVRKYSKEEDSIKKAVQECMERRILADYLRRKGSEVMNMLIAEYSYEKDIQVKQEEAFQIGEQLGESRGKKEGILLSSKIFQTLKENPDYTNRQIADMVACTVKDVRDVRKMFSI
jgi:hypothetical protein